MNTSVFIASLVLALLAPALVIAFMKPVLVKVLRLLCDADGSAEFWVRSAYLLAVCGTGILLLMFGEFSAQASLVDVLRRTLLLVFGALFFSIAFIARNVWSQVGNYLAGKQVVLLPAKAEQAGDTLSGGQNGLKKDS